MVPPTDHQTEPVKSFWYLQNRKKTVEYAQPRQLCSVNLCMFCVSTGHVHWDLSKQTSPGTQIHEFSCLPPNSPHLLLDSPAFQSCFMSLLQNNFYFNIFLISTWALACSREVKFPPAMFCNLNHTCTAQHLLPDLPHGYSPRLWYREQLFSIHISPEYD